MITSVLALVLWFLLFLWVSESLPEVEAEAPIDDGLDNFISVLVAMRNEEEHIDALLTSMNNSIGINGSLTVVLVDDSSTDDSISIAERVEGKLSNIDCVIIKSEGKGKKEALLQGLQAIDGEWLLLTDADCLLMPTTIRRLIDECKSAGAKVIFGPVLMEREGLWSSIQRHEHLNNQISSQGLFAREIPVMVNGANMLLHRSAYELFKTSLDSNWISGDDVLFASSVSPNERAMSLSRDAAVITQPMSSLTGLWNQRMRWLSKQENQGKSARLISTVIFLISVLHIYAVITMLMAGLWTWLGLYMLIRFLVEFSFHNVWFTRLHEKVYFFSAVVVSLFYPIYIIVLGGASLFKPSFNWKGRRYRA